MSSETTYVSPAETPGNSYGIEKQPNKFARPPGIEVRADCVTIHGYQEFQLSRRGIKPLPIDKPLRRKEELTGCFFSPEFLTGKTVLDVGANGGFFSLTACRNGASQVVSLDMDKTYLDLIRQAQTVFGWKNIRLINAKVQDWKEPADLVVAFAMVHWLYSCTANYGSMEAVVGKLAGLSRAILLIEWVAPDDIAIRSFKHTESNPQVDGAGYNLEAFEAALSKHFCKVEILGATAPTRTLYAAYHQLNEVTLHPTLPLLAPADQVISSHCLTAHENTAYYGRVYADMTRNCIIKQATADMALHEAMMLGRLQGAHFPKVISSEQHDGYSVLVMERIAGADLAGVREEISSTPKRLAGFMEECLAILSQLHTAAVRHRDIRLGNIRVRDSHPVLIDFGWAETEDQPYITPGRLGGLERIIPGPPCDTYAMGKVFEQIVPRHSKLFAPLLHKMLAPELARSLPIAAFEQILRGLKLPETWDVPLVFPIPRHPETAPDNTPSGSDQKMSFWKRCRALCRKTRLF
jgi:predicted Ser/Thr protein kinase